MPKSNQQSADTNSNKRRDDFEQAGLTTCDSGSAFSMNTSRGSAHQTFRCADAGNTDCEFETSGDSEDEVMRCVEDHWRRDHGLADWGDAMRDRVRDNIHDRRAA